MTFQVGTKVARWPSFSNQPQADEVVKVHKNGNFVLKSDPRQQWRPSIDGKSARETGTGYDRARCAVWDDGVDQLIAEVQEKAQVRKMIQSLQEKLAGKKSGYGDWFLTPEQLAAARALLATLENSSS